jgi:hypothetical protein
MNLARTLLPAFLVTGLLAQTPVPVHQRAEQYPNLQRALQLTGVQWERVTEEEEAYWRFVNGKSQRLTEIYRELTIEQLRPSPDPMAMGVRQVEQISICRESVDRLASLRQNLRKILNAEQLARLAQLDGGKALLPAISEGQQVRFLDTGVKDVIEPFPGAPPSWGVSWGVSEVPPGCAVSGSIGQVLTGPTTQADRFPNLIRYLGLTDAQVEEMTEVNLRFSSEMGARVTEAAQIQAEMAAESQQAVPDPAFLGAKAARLEQVCRESIAGRAALREAVPKLLSEAQRPRWQELNRALQLLPTLSEAQEINLGGPPASDPIPPSFSRDALVRQPLEWTVYYSGSGTAALPGCDGGFATGSPGSNRWFNLRALANRTTDSGDPARE